MDKEDKLFWALDVAGSQNKSEHHEAMQIIVTELNEREKVVHCKDCKHRPVMKGQFENLQPPVNNGEFDEKCPYVCSDWNYTRMPSDCDFCSRGETNREKKDVNNRKRT